MTALATNLGSIYGAKFGTIQTYKVAAGEHLWRFATMCVRSNGYLYAAIEDISDTEKQLVVGLALEEIDNRSGIDGAKECRVRREGRIRRQFAGSAIQVTIGKLALIKDDQTVQVYGANDGKIVMGRITEIFSVSEVYVDLMMQPKRVAEAIND